MDIDLELVTKTERHLSETIARFKNNLKLCGKLIDGGDKLRANIKRYQNELDRRRCLPMGLVMKSDREIEEALAWFKSNLKLCSKLPDGGDKLRANIKLHEYELQRRQLLAMVVDDECEDTIQVSDDDAEHTSIHNHHRMEMDEQHGTKRQRPTVLILDWDKMVAKNISNKSDRELSKSIARIKNNLKVRGKLRDGHKRLRANLKRHKDELQRRQLLAQVDNECEENIQVSDNDAAEHTSIHNHHRMEIDLELVSKSEGELSETIARFKNNLKLCGKLIDGGERLRANLKRYEDELQRRQLLAEVVDNECEETIQVSDEDAEHTSIHNHHRMEMDEQHGTKRQRPTVLTLNWDKMVVKVISNKSDRELSESVARIKNNLKVRGKLRDGDKRLRANLKRHEDELQRRQLLAQVDNECEVNIQVSDNDAEHTSVHNHHRMEIGGCKRKEPPLLTLGRNKLSQLSTDCPPEVSMTSKSPENCYQTEDLELVRKSDRELNETIAKLRANLKRHQGELQRRQLLN